MNENANKKRIDSRMELFRREINQRRDTMKKSLCRQIDTSLETSLDGLLTHTANSMSKIKRNFIETIKLKQSVSRFSHSGKLLAACFEICNIMFYF